jgi:hypothetical protein
MSRFPCLHQHSRAPQRSPIWSYGLSLAENTILHQLSQAQRPSTPTKQAAACMCVTWPSLVQPTNHNLCNHTCFTCHFTCFRCDRTTMWQMVRTQSSKGMFDDFPESSTRHRGTFRSPVPPPSPLTSPVSLEQLLAPLNVIV